MPEVGQVREAAERRPVSPAVGRRRADWRKRLGLRLASLLCLFGAAALEYYLVNVPFPQEVSGQFHPARVRAQLEGVTFDKPGLADGGKFGLEYTPPTQSEQVLVDAYFDRAQLSQDTLQQFSSLQVSAPSLTSSITYTTKPVQHGSCSTKFEVAPVSVAQAVQFSQPDADSDSPAGFRSLGVSFEGSEAEVVLTSAGEMQNSLSPCRVELTVGDWRQITPGFFPIKIRVPAGANFRFQWQNLQERPHTWENKSVALPLLHFGGSGDQFTASAISVAALNSNREASTPPALQAISERKSTLTVDSFEINNDQLEIAASGKGTVLKNGSVVTKTDLLETLSKNPTFSALFGAGNLALLGWVGRCWFPLRGKKKAGK